MNISIRNWLIFHCFSITLILLETVFSFNKGCLEVLTFLTKGILEVLVFLTKGCLNVLKAVFQSSLGLAPSFGVLLQLSLESVSLLHIVHEFLNVHLKGQSAIIPQHFEEVWTKIPPIPWVLDWTLLLCYGAEMKFVTITTFQEESAWDFLWCFGCCLYKYLSGSCINCAQTNELRVVALKHKLAVCVGYHVFGDQRNFKL